METMETIISGALGALTFGMYWYYISMKQIEEHNRKVANERRKNGEQPANKWRTIDEQMV